MLSKSLNGNNASLMIQVFLVFVWLTDLSVLAGTDTYYSVYLLCGVLGIMALCKRADRKRTLSGKQRFALAIAGGGITLAVVCANYSIFLPLYVLENAFHMVCCLAGGFCVGYSLLRWCVEQLPFRKATCERKHALRVFLLVFLTASAINIAYLLFARYPGVLTTDSISTMEQLNTGIYDNTMPFWHTVTVGLFVKLGTALFGNINAGVAMFHAAQILFMAGCFAFVVMTLYQIGVPNVFLLGISGIYLLMPYNIAYSVTLWKDVPFSGAIVLFLTAFYRCLRNVGNHKIGNYFALVAGGLGMCLMRTNGWYAFAVSAVVLLFFARIARRELIAIILAITGVSWILLNPVLSMLGVKKTNMVEVFAVPMQQVARVVAEERPLSDEEYALLDGIFRMDRLAQAYDPQTVDPVKFECFRYDQVNRILESPWNYGKLYLQLGMRYPGDYWKAWVDETKGYWNGGYNYWIFTKGVGENDLGISANYGESPVASAFQALFRYTEKMPMLQPLISIGLHVWALFACLLVNVLHKRREALLCIPLVVLVVGLWLGTPVFAEFRYAYPVFVSMPLILGATLFAPKDVT